MSESAARYPPSWTLQERLGSHSTLRGCPPEGAHAQHNSAAPGSGLRETVSQIRVQLRVALCSYADEYSVARAAAECTLHSAVRRHRRQMVDVKLSTSTNDSGRGFEGAVCRVWPRVRCPGLVRVQMPGTDAPHGEEGGGGTAPPCWRPYNPLQIAARSIGAASALPLRCCGVGARLSGEDWGGGTLRQGTMSSLCSSSPVEKPAVVQRPTRVRVQSTLLPSEQQRLDSYNKHEVQDGDSIQKLAIKYRVSVSPGRRTLIQTTWPSYANCPRVCRPRSRRSRRRTR